MPAIYLVRHAQASFGKRDYDKLSDIGHRQSAVLGAALGERLETVHATYVGEMRRHRETAAGCLSAMRTRDACTLSALDPSVLPGLNEFDAKDMIRKHDPLGLERLSTGMKILRDREARAHFEALFTKAMVRWTSGEHESDYDEPWRVFAARCNDAVERIGAALGPGETALVFTSAGPISAVAQRCLGTPNERVQSLNRMIVNCSVTKLVVGRGGVQLSVFNEHASFEGRADLVTYR